MSSNEIVQAFRARASAAADQRPLRANPSLAVAIGGIASVLGFVLLGPFVSRGAADDAGMLSFLLGEGRRAPAMRQAAPFVYAAQPRYDAPRRSATALPAIRLAKVHVRPTAYTLTSSARLALQVRKTPVILAVTPPTRPKLLAANNAPTLLDDETLRRGDAVMTANGVRIFNGARHFPFRVADFRPLANTGRIAHRNVLLAIDRVARAPIWSAAFSATSPLAALAPGAMEGAKAMRIVETDRRT